MKQPSGVLLLNKKQGITSAKAIAEVKYKLSLKKIGHAGTLDPMATGLLICLVNDATKLASIFQKSEKIYSGTILLGRETNTDDIEGDTISTAEVTASFDDIKNVIKTFKGKISQIPPQVSAVHINGTRAYELSRKGIKVEIAAREVEINEFLVWPHKENEFGFKISCSSGTYIRSIARDIGKLLGCGGCLSSLKREGSAPFSIDESASIEHITLDHVLSVKTHCNEESCSCHH